MWNFGLCGLLLWIDRRWQLPRGSLMAVYVAGYGVGRLWVESLRIYPANEIAGLRVNQWMAILAIIGGVAYTVWAIRRDGVTRQTARTFASGE